MFQATAPYVFAADAQRRPTPILRQMFNVTSREGRSRYFTLTHKYEYGIRNGTMPATFVTAV